VGRLGLAIEAARSARQGRPDPATSTWWCSHHDADAMVRDGHDVQNALGINGGAFDVNAACRVVYGLVTRAASPPWRPAILLIGSDTLTASLTGRPFDCLLVGDGAGAAVIETVEARATCSAGT